MTALTTTRPVKVLVCVGIVVEPDDGRFHAFSPMFKGLHVDGDTETEALDRATEAAQVYILSLAEHGESVPIPRELTLRPGATLYSVNVQWPSNPISGTNSSR